MRKTWRIFEYGYLIVAIVFIVETVLNWNSKERAYMFLGFAVLAVFMFFFKRRFRKRIEKRNKG